MKRMVIGTAGHIDHGKTALVKALTGIDTDRLKEEKKRGISIELGFAPFDLPDGQRAAIVDVPGHERFIRHMLAGAFGIDMVLLVIAADEGIMPQTREHLDIIELLGVNKGIIVVSKIDLVDEEWLMLVEDDIRQYMGRTILRDAPVIPVSAVTRQGIPELTREIMGIAAELEEKPVSGQARLPIDRVFTMPGFGTVVTGTLWSGQVRTGDNLELMPVQKPVKIRTLQVHREKVDTALAGQRVAVNLQGVEVADIKRGYWLASPGFLTPSFRVDTHLHLLASGTRTLKNWNRIRFHLGTDEAMGRIVLLDRDELIPGEAAYAQIVLEKPVVAYKGDRFVIRYYSPVSTIGGGTIIDPAAPKQKRFREDVLEEMVMKGEGNLYDVLLHELDSNPGVIINLDDLAKKSAAEPAQVRDELSQLIEDEKVLELKGYGYISTRVLEQMKAGIVESLGNFHRQYTLRPGYPKEEMRSRHFKKMEGKAFNLILKLWEDNGVLSNRNNQLQLNGFVPRPNDREQKWINHILEAMSRELFAPPALEELKKETQIPEIDFQEIINFLVNSGQLVKINQEIYVSRRALERGKEILQEYFQKEQELNLGTARDLFNTSRKYALPLIEYFDKLRYTRRVGDVRVKLLL